MSKDTDQDKNMTFMGKCGAQNSVRMAYSLNDTQPVLCTMISDQPFFYMDDEIDFSEEELMLVEDSAEDIMSEDASDPIYNLDDVDSDVLQNELMQLKNKIDAYERISLDCAKPTDESAQQFMMDSHFMTSVPVAIEKELVMQRIMETLEGSHYAKSLLAFAETNKIKIELSDQIDTSAYDKKAGKIFVRGDIDVNDQVLLVAQELRRHWQHHNGALVHPLTFHPDQAVLINRAQLADLSVSVVRVAWELKLSGHKDVWARIENSPLSDLGRALAREALNDFRTLNNGKAAAAVFETWFLSERCRQQDKKLIQAMLADYRGYVFDSAEASRMVSMDLISALGEQPNASFGGKNYLAPYAQMIMNDSIFTDVRDRSNANFLWFIKFEREFQETEQELQSSGLIKNSGISDQRLKNDITEDTENAQQETPFFAKGGNKNNPQQCAPQSDDNVIYGLFGANKESVSERV